MGWQYGWELADSASGNMAGNWLAAQLATWLETGWQCGRVLGWKLVSSTAGNMTENWLERAWMIAEPWPRKHYGPICGNFTHGTNNTFGLKDLDSDDFRNET
ncbi:hypothetical protein C5167_041882 [Papaver somniferum]|nr:hypothetical protein C5167_041882 [Papaver somniferum]